MQTSRTGYPGRTGTYVAFLWQLTLLVGFFALAIWLWPIGLLETPLSEFTLGYVLRAVVSIAFLSVGLTSLYLVVVVPFLHGYDELHTPDED
jgi:hypothetical protein